MRIGVLTTSYPRHGGDIAGRFVAELAGALADGSAPDVVEVLAPSPARSAHPDVEVLPVRGSSSLLYGAGAPDNLFDAGNLRELLNPRRVQAWSQVPAFCGRLALACGWRATRWDAVISHWLLPCGAVAAASTWLPHLAVAHSSDVHLLRRLPRPLGAALLRLLCREPSRLVLTSESLRLLLLEVAARSRRATTWVEQAAVQPMGLWVNDYARSDQIVERGRQLRQQHDLVDRPLVLFIGRLVPVKGVDRLLRATGDASVVIVGDGPERGRLQRLSGQLGVDARFVGQQTGETKRAWLATADLLALPSLVLPDGRTDSAPVVVLEAMAAGLPVVASEVGGVAALIDHERSGLLVAAGDVEALRRAIARLIGSVELRERLADNARRRVSALDWRQVAARVRDLVSEMRATGAC